jgi:hypothetical protein
MEMDKSLILKLLSECISSEIEVDEVQYDQMMLIYNDFNDMYLLDYMRLMCPVHLLTDDVSVLEPKLKLRVREIDFGDGDGFLKTVPVTVVKKAYVLTEKRARSLEKRRFISSQWRGLSVAEKDEWKLRAREWNVLNNKKSTGYNRYLSHMYKELSSVPVSPEVDDVIMPVSVSVDVSVDVSADADADADVDMNHMRNPDTDMII